MASIAEQRGRESVPFAQTVDKPIQNKSDSHGESAIGDGNPLSRYNLCKNGNFFGSSHFCITFKREPYSGLSFDITRVYRAQLTGGEASLGRREDSQSSSHGVFDAAELRQKRMKFDRRVCSVYKTPDRGAEKDAKASPSVFFGESGRDGRAGLILRGT